MGYGIAPYRRAHGKFEQLLTRRQIRLGRKVLDYKLLPRRHIQCLAASELPVVNVDAPRKLERLNANTWSQADRGGIRNIHARHPREGDRRRTICSVTGMRVLQHQ